MERCGPGSGCRQLGRALLWSMVQREWSRGTNCRQAHWRVCWPSKTIPPRDVCQLRLLDFSTAVNCAEKSPARFHTDIGIACRKYTAGISLREPRTLCDP